ncbi:hypothetical protein SpCBS45565_g07600 [Spizellomyces sp. 'palustris']|nr:hypothetical protein SpCBS45565_g07600 [Spizellomyces sp. 'palustris']
MSMGTALWSIKRELQVFLCDYSSTKYRMLSSRFSRAHLMRGTRGDGQWASVVQRNYGAAGYGNKDPKHNKEEVGETHTQRFKNAPHQEATSSNVKSKGSTRQSSANDDIPPPISDPHSTAPTETERLGGTNQENGSKRGTYTRT